MWFLKNKLSLRSIDGVNGCLVSSMFEQANVNALQDLSSHFLHSLVAAILDCNVNCNGITVVVELGFKYLY